MSKQLNKDFSETTQSTTTKPPSASLMLSREGLEKTFKIQSRALYDYSKSTSVESDHFKKIAAILKYDPDFQRYFQTEGLIKSAITATYRNIHNQTVTLCDFTLRPEENATIYSILIIADENQIAINGKKDIPPYFIMRGRNLKTIDNLNNVSSKILVNKVFYEKENCLAEAKDAPSMEIAIEKAKEYFGLILQNNTLNMKSLFLEKTIPQNHTEIQNSTKNIPEKFRIDNQSFLNMFQLENQSLWEGFKIEPFPHPKMLEVYYNALITNSVHSEYAAHFQKNENMSNFFYFTMNDKNTKSANLNAVSYLSYNQTNDEGRQQKYFVFLIGKNAINDQSHPLTPCFIMTGRSYEMSGAQSLKNTIRTDHYEIDGISCLTDENNGEYFVPHTKVEQEAALCHANEALLGILTQNNIDIENCKKWLQTTLSTDRYEIITNWTKEIMEMDMNERFSNIIGQTIYPSNNAIFALDTTNFFHSLSSDYIEKKQNTHQPKFH